MISETSKQQQPARVDENKHFRTEHLQDDLGGRSARGGAVILAAQGCKFVLSTAAAILLARLLVPEDYGLIGMVSIMVGFLGMFQYMGLSTATVRWAELNHLQVSNLFWMNIALSVAIMLLTLASSPLVAWFYHDPRLIPITAGYAVIILLTGLSIQHEAILMRQMRFGVTAAIEIAAMAIGLGVATIAAWFGAGYWALVLNQFVLALVTIVGVWTACRWRPGLPSRGTNLRSMCSYGGNLTGFNLMNFVSRNLDNALIGKFWGPYQLGIYSRAYQMLLMPMSQINGPLMSVAVPALSRLADMPVRYRAAYLKILEKIAMISMPAVVFMIATSDWLVVFLLGAQWRGAGRIFMWLGVAAIIQPVTRSALWLFTTQGRARELFVWGAVSATIAVLSILAGLPWGAIGVAVSYAAADLGITTPLLFWYAGRRGPVRTADFYRTIAPATAASLCSLAALVASRSWLEAWPYLIARLSVAFIITVAVSLLVFTALPNGRLALSGLKETLMLLWKRERIPVV
jgi:O-antigen/teichoic acid export membrane protein